MRARNGSPWQPKTRTAAQMHQAWLSLVDTDGPFLAVPPLARVWTSGMPDSSEERRALLGSALPLFVAARDRWDRARGEDSQAPEASLDDYRGERDQWVTLVLRDIIGWGELLAQDEPTVAPGRITSPTQSVHCEPTLSLRHDDQTAALVWVIDPVDDLRDSLTDGWESSPIDRMEQMLDTAKVPIGVVTDGQWWAIVSLTGTGLPASGVFDALTWVEEPSARNALMTLISRHNLLAAPDEQRLPALFAESVLSAEAVTESLGVQVRAAVELIVTALSEGSLRAQESGASDPLPDDPGQTYEAAVTMMMRIVFLLFAEERGLLPQDQLFAAGYGLSDRFDVLDGRARQEGEESLDITALTWHRLLATSGALHRGASFEDMRLPAYGGSLFDPERFDFLTATNDHGALRVVVSDRVMWHVLRSVQVATVGNQARRVSFQNVDVEQIGYIYEGLLGYTCQRAETLTVGLKGKKGAEPEMTVDDLDDLAEEHVNNRAIAEAIRAWAKEHQPASVCPSAARLTKDLGAADSAEDADRALRSVTDEDATRDRLRPWMGVIRRDLRDRPVVIVPGGLLVSETPSRRNAGAHYTPKALAEEVVQHALEPLCYRPGPHQTADRSAWKRLSSTELLNLKVADIACGSGAFLVAAAQYLSARVVEAWRDEDFSHASPDALRTRALRSVVARCLYGADINAMAVEMCKLSLWLVSLDRDLPFSFVDDKVLHGNSLLGLTSIRQLEALHITPAVGQAQGRFEISGDTLVDPLDASVHIARAVSLRRELASPIDDTDPQRSAAGKRRQLGLAHEEVANLSLVADGVIAAGLVIGGKLGKALDAAYGTLRLAVDTAFMDSGVRDTSLLEGIVDRGLTPTVETDYERWEPLHWILEVPDVMERGGFDAVIGNPPFLGGQKLTSALGTNVRGWFVNVLANGDRGSADLVAYFFLRAASLLKPEGTLGLIATNTIAQGDTREVGLDRLVESGFSITRSIQSRSWPAASANLEYAGVWGTMGTVASSIPRVSDDLEVIGISTLLEPMGRVDGLPRRLLENTSVAFQGCLVLGMGFVLEPAEAHQWIDDDPRNAEVLFPYLNGEDLNSQADTSASRWVIDFGNRDESKAQTYPVPYGRLRDQVRPQRSKLKIAYRRDNWWLHAAWAPKMRDAIEENDEVLVIARVSKTVMPVRVSTGSVFNEMLVVFATEDFSEQAVLSSSLHQMWAIKYGSGMRSDPRYTPTDVFETFPRPGSTDALADKGRVLDVERREIMVRRDLGLTKLYNLVNDPEIHNGSDPDVARMREIHVELDHAAMAAYGWDDVPLDHGFHTYRQMERWTVSPAARVEILDRLLEENHRRYAKQEQS